MTPIRRAAMVAVIAALTAGCGSTVQQTSQGSPAAAGDSELSATSGIAGTAGDVPRLGRGGTATGPLAVTGSTSVGGSSAGSVARSSAAGQRQTGANGQAVAGAHTPVSIGFIYTTGREQATKALGATGITAGDELAQWKVLVRYVNSRGGLRGHPIVPVYFGIDDTSSEPGAQQEAAACSDFTQDHHVFAAMSSFETSDTFLSCMQAKGVPTLITLESLADAADFKRLSLHFEPGALNLDRQARSLAAALKTEGYLPGAGAAVRPKVGIFTFDTPAFDHAAHVLAASVNQLGGSVAPQDIQEASQTNAGNAASSSSSAVLKFRTDGVDHVLFLDGNGLLAFLFMQQAQSQGYHPRYGLTSQSSGTHLAGLLGPNANPQLANSVGIGWLPALDLAPSQYPDKVGTATKVLCVHLMRAGGQSYGLSSPGAELVALGQCDDIFGLQAAAAKETGLLTAASIVTGFNALGSSYVPALSFTARLDADHHDGVSSVRNVAYSTSCKCFNYTSQPYPASD